MRFCAMLCAAFGALAMFAGGSPLHAEPKAGDVAPEFELPGSDGKVYRLADFADKEVVVLAWFPKAFTGG